MMVAVTLCVSVITPVISLLLLFFTDLRANAVIWGFLITQGGVGAVFYVLHFIRGKCFYNKEYWSYALKYNIPLIPHYLSLIVLGQSDRIMISKYCGVDKTAIYNLAYQVSTLMSIFISAINSSFVPWIYEKLKEKKYANIRKISNGLSMSIAAMTLMAILIAPEIVRILGTEEYLEAIWIIPAVAISTYFTFVYGLFSDIEFYYGETKYVMIASTTGAILNVCLNAIFIPIFGFVAAGYTTLFCYLVFMVMHFLFMVKICRKETKGDFIYDIKFIILSCVILCACGGVCLILYKVYLIRYAVITVILAGAVVKRKNIINIITNIKR
jgi:O-antigen/teichoic acid export membrane protein